MIRYPLPVCGSRNGFQRHLERGEEPCDPCRVARTTAETEIDTAWAAIQPARIEPRAPQAEARPVVSPFADRPLPPRKKPRAKALPKVGKTSTPKPPAIPACGTPEAYRRHQEQGEVIDPTCWNAAQRRRKTA